MWRLVRLDLEYLGWYLVPLIVVAVPAASYPYRLSLPFHSFAVAVCALAPLWVANARLREHRDRQLVLLPVPARTLAAARLLSCAIPAAVALVVHGVARGALHGLPFPAAATQLALAGLILLYSAWFVVQDVFPKATASAQRPHLKARALALASVVACVVALNRVVRGGHAPWLTNAAAAARALYLAPCGPTVILLTAAALSMVSVATFTRRRSYLQN